MASKNKKAADATADREANFREEVAAKLANAMADADGPAADRLQVAWKVTRRALNKCKGDRAALADIGAAMVDLLNNAEATALDGSDLDTMISERDALNGRIGDVQAVRAIRDDLAMALIAAGMTQEAAAGVVGMSKGRVVQVRDIRQIVKAAHDKGLRVTAEDVAPLLRAGGPGKTATLASIADAGTLPGREAPAAREDHDPLADLVKTLQRAVNGSKSIVCTPESAGDLRKVKAAADALAAWAASNLKSADKGQEVAA